MDNKIERNGELIIFSGVFVWAFFPVLTVLSFAKLSSLVSLFWVTVFSAILFVLVIAYKKNWKEFRNPLLWKYSLFSAFFIGVMYYSLYFWGLTKTTPGNASIIALFEVFTSFIFFNLLKREKISSGRVLGAVFVVLGACIVLLPNFNGINAGDFLVLLATFFPPAGNYFTQKARKFASAESLLFLRSLIAVPFLFILVWVLHMHVDISDINSSLFFLLINGFIIFGLSKILWVEGIHRISVTKAIALSSTGPLITLFFSWVLLHQVPSLWQISAVIPMIIGVLLLTDQLEPFKANAL